MIIVSLSLLFVVVDILSNSCNSSLTSIARLFFSLHKVMFLIKFVCVRGSTILVALPINRLHSCLRGLSRSKETANVLTGLNGVFACVCAVPCASVQTLALHVCVCVCVCRESLCVRYSSGTLLPCHRAQLCTRCRMVSGLMIEMGPRPRRRLSSPPGIPRASGADDRRALASATAPTAPFAAITLATAAAALCVVVVGTSLRALKVLSASGRWAIGLSSGCGERILSLHAT